MKTNFLTIIAIVLIVLSSCKKDEKPEPTPAAKGSISSSVNLYDEGISKIDNSGMSVTLEGTSPGITATTAVDGSFTLTDVPYGTYTLLYEKSGYGTFKRFNVVHNAGNSFIPAAPSLGQKSSTSITNLTVSSNANFPVILGVTTNPAGNQANTRYIRFFFSTDQNVSNEIYDSYLETYPVNISPYNLNLSQASLDALEFTKGSTVYVKCYGESFWGNSYSEPALNRDIFPNLNPNSAPAVSFVVP